MAKDTVKSVSWVPSGGLLISVMLWVAIRFCEDKWAEKFDELVAHGIAVFAELWLVLWLIEKKLRSIEQQHELENRKDQLRLIKGYMFQGQMRDLFTANFAALEVPPITFQALREAGEGERRKTGQSPDDLVKERVEKLKAFRRLVEKLEVDDNRKEQWNFDPKSIRYRSDDKENMYRAKLVQKYIQAEDVWKQFVTLAVQFNLPYVINDMAEIQSCLVRVKRRFDEKDKDFITNLSRFLKDDEGLKENKGRILLQEERDQNQLKEDIHKILAAGIYKFLQYAEELAGEVDEKGDSQKFAALMSVYKDKDEQTTPSTE